MSEKKDPACIDCKHCMDADGVGDLTSLNLFCVSQNLKGLLNTDDPIQQIERCGAVRAFRFACGREAKWFEKRGT